MKRLYRILLVTVAFTPAFPSPAQGDDPFISEFMALNRSEFVDEDGDESDWIEIHHPGIEPADMDGWYLTDNSLIRTKWRFPAVTIEPGGFLVVFASGKDRREVPGELHTNFQIDDDGEYLALVRPDGITVAHEFAPRFPEQVTNISYGIGQHQEVTPIAPADLPMRVFVPASGALGKTWTGGDEPFDDSGWTAGFQAAGYVQAVSGFAVINYIANDEVGHLDTAEQVISDPGEQAEVYGENAEFIDYLETSAYGHFTKNRPFPGSTPGQDVENFVILATGTITLPQAGLWTFGVLSDDGFGLDIWNDTQPPFRIEHPDVRGPGDTLGTFNAAAPGDYNVRLVMYERRGGSGVEFYAARGSFASWSAGAASFRLVGDTGAGGLAVRSAVGGSGSTTSLLDLIHTDLEASMPGVSSSAYIRVPFNVTDPQAFDSLTLKAWYEDGFVAYLNGVEIARRNAPPSPAFNSLASSDRPARLALEEEQINVSEHLGLLTTGQNILAFHGLNDRTDSPDFLLQAELLEVIAEFLDLRFFDEPTPGKPNSEGFVARVADTKFDPDRGFYGDPFQVTITTATPDAEIFYTTDGSEPGPGNGELYTGPITINCTTVLRAAAFREGYLPTNVDTHSYFFLDDIIRQNYQATINAGFPTTWGGTSPDYGMDPDVIGQTGPDIFGGKYAATIRDDLLSLPALSIALKTDDMFGPQGIYTHSTNHGYTWERPCSTELIFPDGTEGFQVNCGIRIQGGWFRSHSGTRKHSFRLLFKAIYGPTKLNYPWFGEDAAGSFDTVTLRAGANDGYSWSDAKLTEQYTRDEFGRSLQLATGNAGSHGTFVHLYINGIYWGLYNPVERPDHSFAASYHGGKKENWDAIHDLTATHGDTNTWYQMISETEAARTSLTAYQRLQGKNPDGIPNPNYPHLLDIPNYADYLIVNLWGGNWDWPWKNWWACRDRTPESTGFKFYCWDYENTMGNNRSRSPLNKNALQNNFSSAGVPHGNLKSNPEYRMLFADRVHRFLFNGGVLTYQSLLLRYLELADQVERAIVAESARWGDQHHHPPLTLQEWINEWDWIVGTYLPQRTDIVLQQFRDAGLYPSVAAPSFNQHGGPIPDEFELRMTAPSGTIYYTMDGNDPRLPGGSLSPTAVSGNSALIETTTLVRARARAGSVWSALNEALFVDPGARLLRVTEIMYHPPDPNPGSPFGDEDFEFIEFQNTGIEPLDLTGIQISRGIQLDLSLAPVKILQPGDYLVAVSNLDAFAGRYETTGIAIAGVYSGNLGNGGERLALTGPFGEILLDFAYDDGWYAETDGGGYSLELIDPLAPADTWSEKASWRASREVLGSPGIDGSGMPSAGWQRPGDSNQDGGLDISDALSLLFLLFTDDSLPLPCQGGSIAEGGNLLLLDMNNDIRVDVSDVVHLLTYLFLSGPSPFRGEDCQRFVGCPNRCF